ncbi:uncharacterized protein Fot_11191 [Forsythia ovata]|uniref:Ubiquitin-like protease family profile domain-containing protein n=1 Tax=Forsythia ovata TaxID=205694 RepID=A0ABD1WIZ1_9LAMI
MSVVLEQQQYFKNPCCRFQTHLCEFPKHGQKWESCTHLYFSVCSRSHWYVVEVDIAKSTMFIYDPDRGDSKDDQIRSDLKPMTTILPMLLKKMNIVVDALAIERKTTSSKQSNS